MHVQELADVTEGLLSALLFSLQAFGPRAIDLLHQSLIEGIAATGYHGEQ